MFIATDTDGYDPMSTIQFRRTVQRWSGSVRIDLLLSGKFFTKSLTNIV